MLHICDKNGLPAWDVSREIITSTQPVETAFDGAVRVYDIVPMENEVDSLALFVTKRRYRRTNTSKYYVRPRKAQLSAKEVLEKEKADGTEKVTELTYLTLSLPASCCMRPKLTKEIQGWFFRQHRSLSLLL